MTEYIVGSDHSGGKDQECINKVVEVLNANGHNASSIGVNSNLESDIRKNGKGKTAIFIVNGVCIGTIDSHTNVVKSGLCDFVWFAMPQSINPSNEHLSAESCKSWKVPIAHDDNFTKEPRRSELNGKYTIAEYCQENGQYVGYACGKDCEEVANVILNGGTGGGSGGSSDSSENKTEPTPMSYADMIKDLIKVWDGDVEVKIRQNKMYINKVPKPNPQLWIVDGTNVVSGQAKVTDYNSDTINKLIVSYNNGKNEITLVDEYLYNRFGENVQMLKAEKIVTDYSVDGSVTGGDSDGSSDEEGAKTVWTQIAEIVQKYYDKPSNGWDSLIRSLKDAKTGDEIGKILSKQKKKKGQENQSYVSVRHEIQSVRNMGY